MLSRNADSTKMMASSAKPPFQSSGRMAGITSGTLLLSKWRDSSAKPIRSRNRLASTTHSWPMWPASPASPVPNLKPVNSTL